MPHPRSRNRRAELVGVGREPDDRVIRQDPIFGELFAEILNDGLEPYAPAAIQALQVIEDMRSWGIDVTPDIARSCLVHHMWQQRDTTRYNAEQEQIRAARRHPPIVYYMRLGDLVKIGYTTNLTARLESINPQEVMTTEPGGPDRERRRHEQFAALRVHGEWFRLAPPLTDHIEAVRREAAGE